VVELLTEKPKIEKEKGKKGKGIAKKKSKIAAAVEAKTEKGDKAEK